MYPRQVRFLPEWTGPTITITPGDSVRVIARRLNATLSTLNMIEQPAYDFIIACKTDEGTATPPIPILSTSIGPHRGTTTWQRRMRFRGLKFDSDTSGAARRNQEI